MSGVSRRRQRRCYRPSSVPSVRTRQQLAQNRSGVCFSPAAERSRRAAVVRPTGRAGRRAAGSDRPDRPQDAPPQPPPHVGSTSRSLFSGWSGGDRSSAVHWRPRLARRRAWSLHSSLSAHRGRSLIGSSLPGAPPWTRSLLTRPWAALGGVGRREVEPTPGTPGGVPRESRKSARSRSGGGPRNEGCAKSPDSNSPFPEDGLSCREVGRLATGAVAG